MEELLKKGSSGKDEISEKYLRINGRYITDGQVFFHSLIFFLYLQSFEEYLHLTFGTACLLGGSDAASS